MFKTITKSELACLLKARKNFKIINIEPENKAANLKSIPRALLLSEEILEQKAAKILNKNELIVVCYTDENNQAQSNKRATDKLLSLGYKHVIEYFG